MKTSSRNLVGLAVLALVFACGDSHDHPHPHDDGDDPGAGAANDAHEDDHAHAEESIGKALVGEIEVELAQGHGGIAAGAEGHLVVKLPYTDSGATTVRAWIGTADRTLSYVGKGEYAAAHDDYDVHATAPNPLPEGAQWWIEIQKPDGTKAVGAAKPLMR